MVERGINKDCILRASLSIAIEDSSLFLELKSGHDNVLNFCVITCREDCEQMINLVKSSDRHKLSCPTTCQIIPIDIKNADFIAGSVNMAEIVVVVLSDQFSACELAFQTLIYTIRSVRKPVRYFNLMKNYFELMQSPKLQESHLSLLVGNAMIHSSWEIIWEGWISNYKTSLNHDKLTAAAFNKSTIAVRKTVFNVCCYSKSNEREVNNIKKLLVGFSFIDAHNLSFTNTLNESNIVIGCALIFVSFIFSKDNELLETLDYIRKNDIPLVIVVFETLISRDKCWSRTGLGLILANELWVDFTTKPFYLPGEVIPSFERKILELSTRISSAISRLEKVLHSDVQVLLDGNGNGKLDMNSEFIQSTDVIVGNEKPQVFLSHCWKDSEIATSDKILWPLPNAWDKSVFKEKEHDTLKYASMLSASGVNVEIDMKILIQPEDFYDLTTKVGNSSHFYLAFWSTEYASSYYCMCDMAFAMLSRHKKTVIVLLEDINSVKTAMKAMPGYEKILAKLSHLQISSDKKYFYSFNLFLIPAVNRSFEEVSQLLLDLIFQHYNVDNNSFQMSHHSKMQNPITPSQSMHMITNVESSCDVLISYCWNNSKTAYDAGQISFYEGHTDPRVLKRDIERATGLRCWIDVEQLGSKGLYQGIHEASDNAKCILLCISDEYCRSPNCVMELEYNIRRKPCAVACVGSGYSWRDTPAGYFVGYQEIYDFVLKSYPQSLEGRENFEFLIQYIQQLCAENRKAKESQLR